MESRDDGYTVMELLIVIVILGILTSVVALVATGMSTQAASTGCLADQHQLHVAAEAFFAQTGLDVIPATGAGNDRFEVTLTERDFLRSPSTLHDLSTSGTLAPEQDSSC